MKEKNDKGADQVTCDSYAVRFAGLWTSAQPNLRRYVGMLVHRPVDVDDILQLTATRLWEKFDEYEDSQPFLPWAIQFAYFEVLSWRQRMARDRHVFSETLLTELHQVIKEEAPINELRREALNGCLNKLGLDEKALILKRYAEHGAIQREARKTGTPTYKLYYKVDQLRLRLLECINGSMRKEGFSHA